MSEKVGGAGRTKSRRWVLAATVAAMLAASVASGKDREPCRTAYLESGLAQQQVTLEEFRELSGDGPCTPSDGLAHTE